MSTAKILTLNVHGKDSDFECPRRRWTKNHRPWVQTANVLTLNVTAKILTLSVHGEGASQVSWRRNAVAYQAVRSLGGTIHDQSYELSDPWRAQYMTRVMSCQIPGGHNTWPDLWAVRSLAGKIHGQSNEPSDTWRSQYMTRVMSCQIPAGHNTWPELWAVRYLAGTKHDQGNEPSDTCRGPQTEWRANANKMSNPQYKD